MQSKSPQHTAGEKKKPVALQLKSRTLPERKHKAKYNTNTLPIEFKKRGSVLAPKNP